MKRTNPFRNSPFRNSLFFAALAAVLAAQSALADPPHRRDRDDDYRYDRRDDYRYGRGGERTVVDMPSKNGDREPMFRVTISDRESAILRDYYGPHHQKSLPPGLQKKVARGGDLPPGWQKKLARGEVLDDRYYRSAEHLPPDILRRLPPQPRGTVLIRMEGKVVRMVQATREIVDILDL